MNTELKISIILKDLGITADLLGYHYIKEAVKRIMNEPKLMGATICLYCEVAKEFQTTYSKVERAIRHSVASGWVRADVETKAKLFGKCAIERPTNSEFIHNIADYMLMTQEV